MQARTRDAPVAASTDAESYAKRVALSRWVQLGVGLAALASFLWMPLLDAAGAYRVAIGPAFDFPAPLYAEDLDGLDEAQRALAERLDLELLTSAGPLRQTKAEPHVPVHHLTPLEVLLLGAAMLDHAGGLGDLAGQTAVVARYLVVAGAVYLLVALLCGLLPLVPGAGPGADVTIIATGSAGLLLLAAHLVTVGFDVADVVPEALFTWQSHLLSVFVVLGVALGSAAPLNEGNVLRCVVGTLLAGVLGIAGVTLWLVG